MPFLSPAQLEAIEWPGMLRPLVDRYGAVAVYRVGLRALRYPPIWVHAHTEAAAVFEALQAV